MLHSGQPHDLSLRGISVCGVARRWSLLLLKKKQVANVQSIEFSRRSTIGLLGPVTLLAATWCVFRIA